MNALRDARERFLLALLLAGAVHLGLLLSIRYEPPAPWPTARSLDITLVRDAAATPPDVQAQEGARLSAPASAAPQPPAAESQPAKPDGQAAAAPAPAAAPPPSAVPGRAAKDSPKPRRELLRPAQVESSNTSEPTANPPDTRPDAPDAERIGRRLRESEPAARDSVIPGHSRRAPEGASAGPALSAESLSHQISEWGAAYRESRDAQRANPRIAYVQAVRASKYTAAAYEKAWQEKVQRVGNLNYPEEARRQRLTGSLVMSVGIRPDGGIYSMKIHQSSEHEVLDEAALRIVRLAAPFAPFPEDLRQELDVLMITRTWRFLDGNRLATTP